MCATDIVTESRPEDRETQPASRMALSPGTLGQSGVSYSRRITESVVTERTPIFPLEEPKPTNVF